MPAISIAARLLRSDFPIPANHWFAVYENDTVELVSDRMAAVLLKQSIKPPVTQPYRGDKDPTTQLTGKLRQKLEVLAAHKRPMIAGKHNSSGQFSKLKALGYASNENGKWTITDTGLIAVQIANGHADTTDNKETLT